MSQTDINIEEIMAKIKQAVRAAQERLQKEHERDRGSQRETSMVTKPNELKQAMINNNLKWDVNPERMITSHRKTIGSIIISGKKMVRKMLRWYINPPWEQQREFNASITKTTAILNDIMQDINRQFEARSNQQKQEWLNLKNDIEEQNRKVAQDLSLVDDRLRRIERNLASKISANPDEAKLAPLREIHGGVSPLGLDYFMFEHRFRGSREEVKERQRLYLDIFIGKSPILDIGCGRGEFVELLLKRGHEVKGIDVNADMVADCQERNLPVLKADGISYLQSLPDDSLGGIFSAQVIEHLESEQIIRLISLAHSKLRPGGVLVTETVNPQVLYVYANQFYLDPSHQQPVHPRTLEFIFQQVGFNDTSFRFSSPVHDMWIPNLAIDSGQISNLGEFNRAVDRLNQLLFGEQDYAVIGVK